MNYEYRLERKEPYIVETELLKNRTHQTFRWRTIAVCNRLEPLKKYKKNHNLNGCRIINFNLEIVG